MTFNEDDRVKQKIVAPGWVKSQNEAVKKVRNLVWSKVREKVEHEVRRKVDHEVGHEVWNEVRNLNMDKKVDKPFDIT